MRQGVLSSLVAVAIACALAALAPARAAGQAPAQGTAWQVALTPWGDPDLQGIWNFGTITPLERPDEYGDREFLTPEEVARLNQESETRADVRPEDRDRDVGLAYNQVWWDRGLALNRTSLIVDPPNGKLPPYTDEGRRRVAALGDGLGGERGYDSWESRSLSERCIVYRPVPVRSSGYNNNNQIVQTPGYVAMLQEQIHEVRIIPLDGRPHLGDGLRLWLGDSRGRWEGSTLVVETTNFNDRTNYQGSGANRHVVERFTRVDADTLRYEFTVTDPTVWTRSWTGEVPWQKTEGPIFEYACHEGNYGMTNLLNGARVQEKAAADAAKKTSSR
jgi:hypothetical protein